MAPGKKRTSPGAEAIKNGTTGDNEIGLSEEHAKRLSDIGKEIANAELVLERRAQAYIQPFYSKRRPILKSIPNFWPQALSNMGGIALHLQHKQDQDAIMYLEDLWFVRDPIEPRCFTLEFHFKPNPYFSDEVLKKEYKFLPSPAADSTDIPDADGLTPAMIYFDWERDVAPQKITINWKDDSKNLTKLHGRVAGEDFDDIPADPGSFFNFFEYADDPFDIGMAIVGDLFPEAIDYFMGNAGDSLDMDDESEDEDDDDDNDEEEIDLEKPRKKQKTS